eukprot:CAMPEP_0196663150 /NCGR_PEP_ID=MMETSP1086-20130531/51690_1 /TAXON_ID=77921 /ORGANISM="Cyanoptyche  gloeocystis , Strain SAG4.97" /LENGTH=47 /DNA_ID= /DNA_START= /DNA_END= /DNA_ORIENTATION=
MASVGTKVRMLRKIKKCAETSTPLGEKLKSPLVICSVGFVLLSSLNQ